MSWSWMILAFVAVLVVGFVLGAWLMWHAFWQWIEDCLSLGKSKPSPPRQWWSR